jgi:hypothetical protein
VVLENVFYGLFNLMKAKLNVSDDEILNIMQEITAKEFSMIKTMRIGKYR